MRPHFCDWCLDPVNVPDDFDEKTTKCVCGFACKWAEFYFTKYMSDVEIDMRSYFDGQGEDQ